MKAKRTKLLVWGIYAVLLLLSIVGAWFSQLAYMFIPVEMHDASPGLHEKLEYEQTQQLYSAAQSLAKWPRNIVFLLAASWALFAGVMVITWVKETKRNKQVERTS